MPDADSVITPVFGLRNPTALSVLVGANKANGLAQGLGYALALGIPAARFQNALLIDFIVCVEEGIDLICVAGNTVV
jgi:hypothetical protein